MKKIAIFLCFLFVFGFLSAQNQQTNYARVKIFASSPEHFNALLQQGVCLENLDFQKGNYIIGEFSDYELEKITATQIPFEILIENLSDYYVKQNEGYSVKKLNEEMKKNPKTFKGNRTPFHFHLGSMGGYLTLEEIMEELDWMRAEYPALISAKAAFPQQTVEGNHIYWVKITNNIETRQEKPKIFYNALIHAREPAGMQQLIYQMWDLLENYGVDPEITYYLDNLELYFIPCVNPDGYEMNRLTNPDGGGMWRKNLAGLDGTDLNRNWGYMWGLNDSGSSPYPWDETYRGEGPFSEVETQILKEFCEEIGFSLCLNNHTYSNCLVFPYGFTEVPTPEYPIFRAYSKRLTSENHYAYGNCFEVLNYYTNGSSDDWMYGEQGILSFTPEAGEPAEGFWPPMHRIEEICAGHVTMNKYLMRFALPFADIEDKTDVAFQTLNCAFIFDLVSLGITENASFAVTIEPVSNNIESVPATPLLFENVNTLDKIEGELPIILKSNIGGGDQVVFDICVNNGDFTHKYRITKLFGTVVKIMEDNCESMSNWTSDTWNTTTDKYVSPASSITDSPYGNYQSYSQSAIYSKNEYDLSDAVAVFAEFDAQWEVEAKYDYVQFLVSENNGISWTPQAGKYTRPGNYYQEYGKPMYDGVQSSWVRETIDLSNFIGKNIKVGFKLVTNEWGDRDGFYFDDFVIKVIKPKTTSILNFPDNQPTAFYNATTKKIVIKDVENATSFSLFNIEGKLLGSFNVNNNYYEINVAKLQSGIYFLKSNTGEAQKVVIY